MLGKPTTLQLLIQAGADVLAPPVLHASSGLVDEDRADAAAWLLACIEERSRSTQRLAGPAAAGGDASALRSGLAWLLAVAAALDCQRALRHFVAALLRCEAAAAPQDEQGARGQVVSRMLQCAAEQGSVSFFRTALHGWAAPLPAGGWATTAAGLGAEAGAPTPAVAAAAAGAAQARASSAAGGASPLAALAAALEADASAGLDPSDPSPAVLAAEAAAAACLLGPHMAGALPEALTVAVACEHQHVLRLLLHAGVQVTAEAVLFALGGPSLGMLLAACAGRPPPVMPPADGILTVPTILGPTRGDYTCPLLHELQERIRRAPRAPNSAHAVQPAPPHCPPTWADAELLPEVEALMEAGFRPAVYKQVMVRRWQPGPELAPARLYERYGPVLQDEGLDLAGHNRWLWMAIQHPDWSPAQHSRYPPAFKAAARTLLLAAQRGSGQRPAASLGSLPVEVLLAILGVAAYPLSAWARLDAAAGSATS
ncbi:hypothetical protein ABPG75_003693 [Micractinium tetrahymenae]